MSEKVVKYGVVGLGRGANIALVAYGISNGQLIAACDQNPETLEKAKARFESGGITGCQYFSDYDEMLKCDIDAVLVATEAVYHVPIVKKALEAGKHVLSEIPSVNSIEEAYELKKAVSEHPDLIYMAAENCCYWAFIESWKQMREKGEFGSIVFAEAEYLHAIHPDEFSPTYYPKGHWRTYNPAIKYITHELGPLLYIMDDRCVSVTCLEPDINYDPNCPNRKGVGIALIKTEKGAVIKILISFAAYTSFDHNFRLVGTRGAIETDRLTRCEEAHSFANLYSIPNTFAHKIEIPVSTSYNGSANKGGHGGADRKMMEDFLSCVAENRKPVLDVDFAINMSLPGSLAHESAVQGGVPMNIPKI